jgi:hypothetical protein
MTRALNVKLDRSFAGDTPARNSFHRGFHRRLQQKDSVPLQHCQSDSRLTSEPRQSQLPFGFLSRR